MIPQLVPFLAAAPATGLQAILQHPAFPLVMMVAVMYFLLFAPMRKKQKQHAEMLTGLKIKDRVVTNGGMLGTVVGLSDDKIQLRIAEKVTVDVTRSSIAGLQSEQ